MIALRSVLFTAAMVATTAAFCILALPFLALPRRWGLKVLLLWSLAIKALARVICGITFEVRGREHIPQGAALVASKHQSAWETLNLVHILPEPSFILKKELTRIPLFGWFTIKFGNLPIDRSGGGTALRRLLAGARQIADDGRPIVIFPEGTRRAPGAPPAYQRGVVALYRHLGLACVPVALNSGLYWPSKDWRRRPGKIIIEFLPAIPAGLGGDVFLAELQDRIEQASAQLVRAASNALDSNGEA